MICGYLSSQVELGQSAPVHRGAIIRTLSSQIDGFAASHCNPATRIPGMRFFDVIFNFGGSEAVRQWRWMGVAFNVEFGAGGFLFRERNVDDAGAAIPQPLDDLVIAETRSLEILRPREIRNESRDAVSWARFTAATRILI